MSPDQVKLVQDSFENVRALALQAADLFYGRLFEMAPELRTLFPKELAEQKGKLMAMLTTAVANLHQIEKIASAVQELGRRHASYGVKEEHYTTVGDALIWTLGQGLGPLFTAAVKDAWIAAYAALATVMKDAARARPASELRHRVDPPELVRSTFGH